MERQREAGGLMEKEGSVDVKRGGLSCWLCWFGLRWRRKMRC